MRVATINCLKTGFRSQASGCIDSTSSKSENSNKNYNMSHIPYFVPILSFCGSNNPEFKADLEENIVGFPSVDIPEDIMKEGFEFCGTVNLQDEEKKPQEGYVFIKKRKASKNEQESIQLLITDNEFDDLGELCSHIKYDKNNRLYAYCDLNNYANVYNESRCDVDSPIKKYGNGKANTQKKFKRVGTELYRVLEEYLKENYPDAEYLEACPVRQGSKIFHEKIGFKYHHTEDTTRYNGWDDSDERSFLYYRKILNIPESITNHGFEYCTEVNLPYVDGKPQFGYAFIKNTQEADNPGYNSTQVLITNRKFENIIDLSSKIKCDKENKFYADCTLNKDANIYEKLGCNFEWNAEKYERSAGNQLYWVLTKYLKENYPDIEYIKGENADSYSNKKYLK